MEDNCLCFFSNTPCIQGLKEGLCMPMFEEFFWVLGGLVGVDPQAGVMAMATDVLTESITQAPAGRRVQEKCFLRPNKSKCSWICYFCREFNM